MTLPLLDGNVPGIVDGSMIFIITGDEVGSRNSTCGDIELGISLDTSVNTGIVLPCVGDEKVGVLES